MKWNDIPFDPNADADVKGQEFDLQVRENGGDPTVTHTYTVPEEDQ